jgi:3',5'-cyclic AMP phosphodiesterase CpdA
MRSFCVVIIRGTIVTLRIALLVALLVAPSARGATSILAIGDFGVGGKRQRDVGAAVRAYEERNPSQLLVTLGDNDYTRGRAFATSWKTSFGWLAAAEVDVAGALGNHDVEVRRGRYEFGLLHMPAPYYVRRVGEVELIVLDSTAISRAQTSWLRRTLASRTGFRRIVVLHHPPFTCGGHLGSAAVQRTWVPLFARSGVKLVLSGHDHNYQRFQRDGVTYVVHGGGGAGLYKLRPCPAGHPRRVSARVGHGFVHVTVEPSGFLVRIVDLAGKTIDRFDVTG